MTTVWILRHHVTDFNQLTLKHESSGTFPREDGVSELISWQPKQVWYHPLDFRENKGIADFPSWSGVTACNAKAKYIIQELIDDHVEFLPLVFLRGSHPKSFTTTASYGEYYAINILTTLDCLDYDRSEFTYFKKTGNIRSVRKRVFKPECIRDVPIFKLPILNSVTTYVTDSFKQLVEDNNLTGLDFKKGLGRIDAISRHALIKWDAMENLKFVKWLRST